METDRQGEEDLDYGVFKELDVKVIYMDEVIYYLKGHGKKYCWMIFLHEEHHVCKLLPGNNGKPLKYHLIIWYRKAKEGPGKYFSNEPFMQFLRRIHRKYNELNYPTIHSLYDVEVHVKHLVYSQHRYINSVPKPHEKIKSLMGEEHLAIGKFTCYFYKLRNV